jgi:2-iminobutanoate/2-iminopropanoate deaminase
MKKIIHTPNAPAAIGPYSQAIKSGNLLFLSGQIPTDPETGEFVPGGIKEQTTRIFKNISAILNESGYEMNHIVKTTVYLSDMSLFPEMNEIYAGQFTGDYPARSTVAVAGLPKKALVEIEVIAVKQL